MRSMAGDIRMVVAVVVAKESPLGRAAEAANDLNRHLPTPAEPATCPTCAGRYWPCPDFDDAANRLMDGRLRLADLVPADLHPRLWPQSAAPRAPQWPTESPPEQGRDHG